MTKTFFFLTILVLTAARGKEGRVPNKHSILSLTSHMKLNRKLLKTKNRLVLFHFTRADTCVLCLRSSCRLPTGMVRL